MTSNASLLLTGVTLVLTLIMPGPTNTLLFFSGAKHGIKHSLILIAAELLGYTLAIGAWCGLLSLADAVAPTASAVLRVCSAAYVGLLAVRMWHDAAEKVEGAGATFDKYTVFCATLLNPKAFFFAAFVFPPVRAGGAAFAQALLLFVSLVIPIGFAWICAGAALLPSARQGRRRFVQRTVAFLLMMLSVSICATAFK
jgi:threonine/homoserine/homoserine lactone efflux protein